MSRTLLGPTSVDAPRRPRTRWTIAGSCVAHAALAAAILVLPALGPIALPPFARPLILVMASSERLPPVPVVPPRSADQPAAIVPLESPDGLAPDRPQPTPSLPGLPAVGDIRGDTSGYSHLLGRGADLVRSVVPPPQPPPTPTVVRAGGKVEAPARITYVAPIYPPIAVQVRREGTVVVEATIDESGVVRDVTVKRSVALLDAAAVAAVRQWRYTPTKLNGMPVSVILEVAVTFSLK
jgi:protein TonB